MSIIAAIQRSDLEKLFHILTHVPPWHGDEILAFRIGDRYCSFAVTNSTGIELYELAYHTGDEVNGNFMSRLLSVYPELSGSFIKVFINYDSSRNLLIPDRFFNEKDSGELIKTLHGANGRMTLINGPVSEEGIRIAYKVPEEVHQGMLSKYPEAVFSHGYKFKMESMSEVKGSGIIRTDFDTESFSVIVSGNDRILLAQTFPYSIPDDVIYYLLKICSVYAMSPKEVSLSISGLIEKRSSLYHELYQYFGNVSFKNAEWAINEDNEYPLHFFTSLNEVIRCGL